jgi:exopolysaccharide/PEP-CTERM locus tyrosine autokinase
MSIIEKAIDRLVAEDERPKHGAVADSTVATSSPRVRAIGPGDEPPSATVLASPESVPQHLSDLEERAGTAAGATAALESGAGSTRPLDIGGEESAHAVSDSGQPTVLKIHGLGLEGFISPQTERSRTAEEFRMIKRPLLQRAFSGETALGERANVIAVTSSVAGEGKTFTSLNLAISIAMELDRTVLLVDADLANPGLSRLLGAQDLPGLTERLLDEKVSLKDLLLRTDVPKLTLLPAGRRHRRSTELLASNTMKGLLDELATRYPDRVVLFDSPPLLATSEASVLTEQAGQICLVVESATTPQFLVKEALGLLRHQDRVSLVLNKTRDELLSGRRGYYYGYRYGYGYGNQRTPVDGRDDAAA